MKLVEYQFDSEEIRDKAALAIIAIRETTPEPVVPIKRVPSLMIWETEKDQFEARLRAQGIDYHVDHETEIRGTKV